MSLDHGHGSEAERLRALRETGLLDSPAERDFDDLVRLTARVCDCPIALVSFVDEGRQWFKAKHGLDVDEMELRDSICAIAIKSTDLTVIEDISADPRTEGNAMCAKLGLCFYAAAPLVDAHGHALGTLCILDRAPRAFSDDERDTLRILARQVIAQVEMRRAHRAYVEALAIAEARSAELQRALDVEHTLTLEIDHRVKNSLQLVGSLLQMQAARTDRPEVRDALQTARSRVTAISTIHGALNRSASINRVSVPVYLAKLVEELRAAAPEGIEISIETDEATLGTSQASSLAILINEFVTNSLKYAFPSGGPGNVTLSLRSDGRQIRARFADDGAGYPDGHAAREGLGTRIMQAVGLQLGATLQFETGSRGTALSFDFPLDPAAAV